MACTFNTMRPKPYDGTTGDLEDFLHAFEMFSDFANWSEVKKFKGLKGMLVDNAAKWLQRQDLEEEATYDELVQLLRARYGLTPTQRFQLRTELATITQGQNETVDNFAERVEQLCNKLDTDEEVTTHQFIQGLQKNIKQHVIRCTPKTMSEAVSAAKAEEGASGATVQTTSNVEEAVREVRGEVRKLSEAISRITVTDEVAALRAQTGSQVLQMPSPPPAPPATMCQLCGQWGHIARKCPQLRNYSSQEGYVPQAPPPVSYTYPQRRLPRHMVQCYNCGKTGHYRRECLQHQLQQYQGNAKGLTNNRN